MWVLHKIELQLLQSAVISERKYEWKFIADKILFTTNFYLTIGLYMYDPWNKFVVKSILYPSSFIPDAKYKLV